MRGSAHGLKPSGSAHGLKPSGSAHGLKPSGSAHGLKLRRFARELGLALLVLAVLTACGIRPTDPIPGLEAPSGPVENTSPQVFWVSPGGGVVPVGQAEGSLSGFDVVALLAQGPNGAEQARGLRSEVPFDAAPATVDRVANGLDVTISSDVSLLSGPAVQQIVCTLLAVQPVGSVNLRGGGHSLEFQKCA